MKMHRVSILVACVASLSLAAFAQERGRDAGTRTFRASISGTCSNKDDFSFTGTPAALAPGGALRIYCQVTGNSSFGRYDANILAEEQLAGQCTAHGASGFLANVKGYIAILTFENGDQLFLQGSTGSECLTPLGVPAPGQGTLSVIGGTGRFQGATGSVNHNLTPIALAFSVIPGSDGFISAFSGTYDGSVNLN
jgi:hypothetical protein